MSDDQLRIIYQTAERAEIYAALLNIASALATDQMMSKENAAKEILAMAEKIGAGLIAKIA